MILTLRPDIQRLALDQLAGRCGAVVVLDAKTGAVLTMASSPTYNANLMVQPTGFNKVKKIKGTCGDASALVNNATAGLYPPGSTFKMVTAAAALDSGAYTPSSPFNDPGYCTEYGQRVSNAGNPDQSGPEAFGNVTLAQGFEHSINSVFCNVGKHIGGEKILEYAKRFGFYSLPPLETPSERAPGVRPLQERKALRPCERVSDRSGAARVRPVQHARHAAADGDGGAGDRERRRRAAAVSRRSHRRARRQPRHPDDAALARPADQAADRRRAEPDDAARRPGRDRPRPSGSLRASRSRARRAPRSSASGASTTRGSSASPPPTTRATSSRPSSRSSRTASAPRSRPRSRRQSSKNCWAADHVSTL